jgi:hypothetical protein
MRLRLKLRHGGVLAADGGRARMELGWNASDGLKGTSLEGVVNMTVWEERKEVG